MLTEERLTYFQIQIQDIRDFKANQWRFSNYGVLIQAALTAVDINLGSSSSPWATVFFIFLSGVTFFAILWLIYEATEQMDFRRSNYIALTKPIEESLYLTYLRFRREKTEAKLGWQKRWKIVKDAKEFAWLFSSVQAVAAVLAMWVIWS